MRFLFASKRLRMFIMGFCSIDENILFQARIGKQISNDALQVFVGQCYTGILRIVFCKLQIQTFKCLFCRWIIQMNSA